MPGPVSDDYDPEFGTRQNALDIAGALEEVYDRLCGVLGGASPLPIRRLVGQDLPRPISATLSEKEWRLLRFAVERAQESI